MGLGALYGASGIEQKMRERIFQRLQEEQARQQMELALRGADRADRELTLRGAEATENRKLRELQTQSLIDARQAAAEQRATTLLSPGQVLTGAQAEGVPDFLTRPEPQRELEAPPGIAEGPQGQPIPGTVANSPSVVGRRFVYAGTPAQQQVARQRQYVTELRKTMPPDSREAKALDYFLATGENAPAGIFEPKEGKIATQNYALDGKPIVAQETEKGRILYQGQDVTDRVTPYVAPSTRDPNVAADRRDRRAETKGAAFEQLPVVKHAQKVAEAAGFVTSLDINTTNPADDQALIYAFAKAMDPDSAVREGEYATIQRYAQSWAESFGFNASRIFSNTQFLTPEARANMKATIQSKYKSIKQQYVGTRKAYADQINRITGGADGESYLTDFSSAFPPDATDATTSPPGTSPLSGRKNPAGLNLPGRR